MVIPIEEGGGKDNELDEERLSGLMLWISGHKIKCNCSDSLFNVSNLCKTLAEGGQGRCTNASL